VPGLVGTEILGPICTEVTRVCQDVGAVVLWPEPTDAIDAVGEADRLTRLYVDRGVDGVFFAPLESAADRQTQNVRIAATMRSAGIAVVLLDRDVLEFPDRSDYDLVGIDNFHAGLRLTQHLIDVGRRRTCFLAKPHAPSTTDLRAAGAREALRRAGITVGSQWQLSGLPNDEGFVGRFLEQDQPDAVICSNDLTAALLIQTLLRMELSVPRDVAVVAFDDVAYSTLLSVELTTMRQPIRGIARAALRVMTDRLEGSKMEPQQILLSADLIVRQSCGAPRTNLLHAEP
jgi:DNA-binding LacI/PurR family transcriptional regulator